ncbi:MAG TPA: HAMP domain-containing sensor histidine kinase [Candidatus Limnocylindrales bacterium]|nr:HAMP domain-containing sensor histidine kinase [Candidatus Limnocylindrales bacterium]
MAEPLPLGPIGRRVLAAFLVVALSSILVLILATVIGVDLSQSAATREKRDHMADDMATSAAIAYANAGSWQAVALPDAERAAQDAGGHLIVVDPADDVVLGGPVGPGFRTRSASAAVVVDGEVVGTVYVGFPDGASQSPPALSTSWVIATTMFTVLLAILLALVFTRRLTRPLVELTETTRAFASHDRSARAPTAAAGELGELARTFNAMADEVTRSDEARRHLSADVAHELRTPLTALQAGLEELRYGHIPPDPATIAALHDQSVRLGHIVNDLSELSQAEAQALRLFPERLDLAEVTRECLATWESRIRAAGQKLEVDLHPGAWVDVDPNRIFQVIGNVVANAVRHCRAGDTIVVSVRRSGESGVLEVRDTGPGIPAEALPHIFDRFYRANGESQGPGSGIGLAVVRALTLAHRGQVDLTSEVGVGTTVTVRLPLAG